MKALKGALMSETDEPNHLFWQLVEFFLNSQCLIVF